MHTRNLHAIRWTSELALAGIVIVLLANALPVNAARATLINSMPLTWYGEVLPNTIHIQAQSFKTGKTETQITQIDLNLYNYDGALGNFSVDLYRTNDSDNQPDDTIAPYHVGGGDLALVSSLADNILLFKNLSINLAPHTQYFVVVSSNITNGDRSLSWGFGDCAANCGGGYESYWSQKTDDTWSSGLNFYPCRMTVLATTPPFDLTTWLARILGR